MRQLVRGREAGDPPPTIAIIELVAVSASLAVHVPRERLHVLERRLRQDAVAEIEDVARAAGRAPQHVVGGGQQALGRTEQQRRIEVALDARGRADARPRLVERLRASRGR